MCSYKDLLSWQANMKLMLTKYLQVGDLRGNSVSFSDQQFEECDALPEDIKYIFRLDTETGEVTHKVTIFLLRFDN